jgi:hypothetical protein
MISDSISPTVAVLGGDPTISRAIEALLVGAGYTAVAFATPPTNGSRHLLDEAQVLLLAPGIRPEIRTAFLVDRGDLPTVDLVPILEDTPDKGKGTVLWPAGAEEIGRKIDVALLENIRVRTDGTSET